MVIELMEQKCLRKSGQPLILFLTNFWFFHNWYASFWRKYL